MVFTPLTAQEQAQIKEKLGALPLRGMAWAHWVKIVAIAVLLLVVVQAGVTIAKAGVPALMNMAGFALLLVFVGLAFTTYHICKSQTVISQEGLQQSWITKRQVKWENITFAKFVPLLASKRLVVFVKAGRPIAFQGGTQELQTAFALISLQFKNRQL